MAQSGYTPILIYGSGTATNVPLAADMTSSSSGAELALNYADGKLYYKNSSGVVTLLVGTGGSGVVAGSNTQVQFNNSGVFGASANLTWDGTTFSASNYLATAALSGSSSRGVYAYGTLSYTDANHILTMQASVNSYTQMEIQNTNTGSTASSDVVVGNNNTTASTYYGDFGMNSSGWTGTAGTNSFGAPNMVYLTATTGDLLIGTTTANTLRFATNAGADSMQINGTTGIVSFPTTGAITLPVGTTGQQPTPAAGMLRFNSTTSQFESYNGTIWSSVMVSGNMPAFSAYQTNGTNQSMPISTNTKIVLNTKVFDTSNAFDSTTNYRFTPQVAGYYQLSFGVRTDASVNNFQANVFKNGGTNVPLSGNYTQTLITGWQTTGAGLVYLNGSTDYVELYCYSGTTVALNSAQNYVYFTGALVRAA